jgi:hypothetical protein
MVEMLRWLMMGSFLNRNMGRKIMTKKRMDPGLAAVPEPVGSSILLPMREKTMIREPAAQVAKELPKKHSRTTEVILSPTKMKRMKTSYPIRNHREPRHAKEVSTLMMLMRAVVAVDQGCVSGSLDLGDVRNRRLANWRKNWPI